MSGISIITCILICIAVSHLIIILHLIDIIVVLLVIRLDASNATHTPSAVDRVVDAASVGVLGELL